MGKFCIFCGKPMPEEAVFCPGCGSQQIMGESPENATTPQEQQTYEAPAYTQPATDAYPAQDYAPQEQQTYEAPAYTQPAAEAYPAQDYAPQEQQTYEAPAYAQPVPAPVSAEAPLPEETEKKTGKKKPKKWLFIGAGAGVAAILIAVFFIFILPLFGGSSEGSGITFKHGGKEYYASPILFKLNGDNAPELVSNPDKYATSLYGQYTADDGNTYYALLPQYVGSDDYDWTAKYTFADDTTLNKNPWVDNELLKNCVFCTGDTDVERFSWIRGIRNMTYDGNYVYFNLIPTMEYALQQGGIAGKVGRISKDGKTIEQVGDLNAYDMIVENGWIYYADCGYNPPSDGSFSNSYDYARAGIYKTKTDGSSKTLLHSLAYADDDNNHFGLYQMSGEMKIIGGKLYFLDYTAEGLGRLCRMDKNGNNFEYLSSGSGLHYTVDNNTAYIYSNSMEPAEFHDVSFGYSADNNTYTPVLYKVDLTTKTQTEMPFASLKYNVSGLDYHNGYLYFISYNFGTQPGSRQRAGLRINTATEKAEWLVYHRDLTDEWQTDPSTGRPKHVYEEGETEIFWEEANMK